MVTIKWRRKENFRLIAVPHNFFNAADELILDEVQNWCEKHNCGIRMSFDEFYFDSQQDILLFLLRWG